ncbi:MAG: penicillin-binding protein 2 [Chloroflexi bacterium]|nr:penicillin-binding protein 2 [Chloroflexota bacterium]
MFGRERRWRSEKKRRELDERTLLALRLTALRLAVVVLFGILLAQLWRLQVVEGRYYQEKAEHNRLRMFTVQPQRGVVFDRNGTVLVRNVPSFTVGVVPGALPKQPEVVYQRLSTLIDLSAEEIAAIVEERRGRQDPFTALPVKGNVDRNTAFLVEEQRLVLPGVVVLTEPIRQYPEGPDLAHILGYVYRMFPEEHTELQGKGYGPNDKIGKTAVEAAYEEVLRGRAGWELVEVDASERKLGTVAAREATPGGNLVLSIDADLQHRVTRFLREGMKESKYAAAGVMDPNTGELLALVSVPTYDNNLFATTISAEALAALLNDPRRPLLNYALAARHPPGSIFKLVTGSAALQEGIATPATRLYGGGAISVPSDYDPSVSYTFRDWGWIGWMDFRRGMAMSSDVYFYYLSGGYKQEFRGLGAERLGWYAREFGLGAPTGIDLAGEVEGLVPDPAWKERVKKEPWYLGNTYNMGIGQGDLLVTPLQMLNVVATVANGGYLLRPTVVRETRDARGNVVRPFRRQYVRPDRPRVPVDDQHLATVRDGMRAAVTEGTATILQMPGVEIAGKTGTAEYGLPDATGKYETTHGWFLGFAPYRRPEIAVMVFVEHGGGATDATPIAKRIFEYYFAQRHPRMTGPEN